MQWSDISTKPTRRVLRQFAAMWLLCFLALGASQYFLKSRPTLGMGLAAVAVAVGVPGLIWPALLRWVFVAAMLVTFPIGWLVSLTVLAFLYFVVITPLAVVFRLRGRDVLNRRPAPAQASFWEPKRTPVDLHSYFRQY